MIQAFINKSYAEKIIIKKIILIINYLGIILNIKII